LSSQHPQHIRTDHNECDILFNIFSIIITIHSQPEFTKIRQKHHIDIAIAEPTHNQDGQTHPFTSNPSIGTTVPIQNPYQCNDHQP
jgi:hypothetical protein